MHGLISLFAEKKVLHHSECTKKFPLSKLEATHLKLKNCMQEIFFQDNKVSEPPLKRDPQ